MVDTLRSTSLFCINYVLSTLTTVYYLDSTAVLENYLSKFTQKKARKEKYQGLRKKVGLCRIPRLKKTFLRRKKAK